MTMTVQIMHLLCSQRVPKLDLSWICLSVLHKKLFLQDLSTRHKCVMSKSIIFAEKLSKSQSQNETEGSACKRQVEKLAFGLREAKFHSTTLDRAVQFWLKLHANSKVFYTTSTARLILTPNIQCNNQQKSSAIMRLKAFVELDTDWQAPAKLAV